VVVALSPVPIVAVILMSDTPRASSSGPAFAIGWVAGLVIVSVIVVLLASRARLSGGDTAIALAPKVLGHGIRGLAD
jgi:hypothetical protein